MKSHTIIYVGDQQKSRDFYRAVLQINPSLDVPGMTEFNLNNGSVLGLMPLTGIKKLLGNTIPSIDQSSGKIAVELYLIVDTPSEYHLRSLEHGAKELSKLEKRDWNHEAAYSLTPDGVVLVFARQMGSGT